MKLKGITVTLYVREQTGTDPFGVPVYTESETDVENVLVAPLSATEILETYNLTGRRVSYQLGIPKGDTNEWRAGTKVRFFNKNWRTIADPVEGIEELVPLGWNKKVEVESYE